MTSELTRFIEAQQDTYVTALSELRAGRKRGHWMWFIFPQLRGLGKSETAAYYAIADLAEAESYLRHPLLGPRLVECTNAVSASGARSLRDLVGYPDDMKFISCMTLFSAVRHAPDIFSITLTKFNDGEPDALTLGLLKNSQQ